jgi:hypothetical protein
MWKDCLELYFKIPPRNLALGWGGGQDHPRVASVRVFGWSEGRDMNPGYFKYGVTIARPRRVEMEV